MFFILLIGWWENSGKEVNRLKFWAFTFLDIFYCFISIFYSIEFDRIGLDCKRWLWILKFWNVFVVSWLLCFIGESKGIGLWKVKFEYGFMSVKIDLVVHVDRQVFLFSNSSSYITERRWRILINWVHWMWKMKIWWWWFPLLHQGTFSCTLHCFY